MAIDPEELKRTSAKAATARPSWLWRYTSTQEPPSDADRKSEAEKQRSAVETAANNASVNGRISATVAIKDSSDEGPWGQMRREVAEEVAQEINTMPGMRASANRRSRSSIYHSAGGGRTGSNTHVSSYEETVINVSWGDE